MRYTVATLREAGLSAKWARTRTGVPILLASQPTATSHWFAVTGAMWERMRRVGVREGFEQATALADYFSVAQR